MSENTRRPTATTPIGWIMGAIVALALLLVGPTSAWAVEEHAFDPVLSLKGDCTTGALDLVADPGPCPGVKGVDHPEKAFNVPCGVAVDSYGDIYVANPEVGLGGGTEGRIDVFNAQGEFLTEIEDENQPCDLTVDSSGNVYANEVRLNAVSVFEPDSYPPQATTTYTHTILHESGEFCFGSPIGIAVDPTDDHLVISWGCRVVEYGSAAEGSLPSPGREGIGLGLGEAFGGVGICGAKHDVVVAGTPFGLTNSERFEPENDRIFVFDGADGHKKLEIDGRGSPDETPEGGFAFNHGSAGIGVDQTNCDFYVGDITVGEAVDQFGADGRFIGQLRHSLSGTGTPYIADLAIDDPYPGQTDYQSPNEGEVYVAQGKNPSSSHLYAFKPSIAGPPEVGAQTVGGVSETEAVLEARLNPGGLDTKYHFEYISQADYEADGGQYGVGAASVPVPDADAGEEASFAPVSIAIAGLQPGTAYRFRLVASNCAAPEATLGECLTYGEGTPGGSGEDASFVTYPPEAGLLDGRGYELVTPADTNGLIPTMAPLGENLTQRGNFDTLLSSPDGESVIFGTEGGSLPALGGGGFHDTYEALRGEGGWQSSFAGIAGTQAERPSDGGISADHGYSFWAVDDEGRGSLPKANYLRLSGGGFEPIGLGGLGVDLTAGGDWISTGAGHVIFHTGRGLNPKTIKLEEGAPDTGTPAVYDRSPGGPTHVVSLLPGNITPADGRSSFFQGASADGTVVVFKTLSVPGEAEGQAPLYARIDNAETIAVAAGGQTIFGGVSRHGERIAYLRPNAGEPTRPNPIVPAADHFPQGNIFSYDTSTETTTPIGSGEKSVLVNVSADGSHVYFDSTKRLGGEGTAGAENLYVWSAATGSTRLVAIVSPADVFGQPTPGVNSSTTDGLGLWINDAVSASKNVSVGPGAVPARSSADGSVLLFESRAKLSDYENAGHAEIYRYDEAAPVGERIACLSCNPTREAPRSDARLQTLPPSLLQVVPPVNSLAAVPNLTPNGMRAFFETGDPLVSGDVDQRVDVYEWEAQGEGTCIRIGGCVSLISSGRSATDNYLYAVDEDGSDVFFETADLLVSGDHDATPSIYDARVGGGFPEPSPAPGECRGEACQPQAGVPNDATPASSSFEGAGNAHPKLRRCPKGARKIRRSGKVHCLKPKHRRRHRHHRPTHQTRRVHR